MCPINGNPGGEGTLCKSYFHLFHKTLDAKKASSKPKTCSSIVKSKALRKTHERSRMVQQGKAYIKASVVKIVVLNGDLPRRVHC